MAYDLVRRRSSGQVTREAHDGTSIAGDPLVRRRFAVIRTSRLSPSVRAQRDETGPGKQPRIRRSWRGAGGWPRRYRSVPDPADRGFLTRAVGVVVLVLFNTGSIRDRRDKTRLPSPRSCKTSTGSKIESASPSRVFERREWSGSSYTPDQNCIAAPP